MFWYMDISDIKWKFSDKLSTTQLPEEMRDFFLSLLTSFLEGQTGQLEWHHIQPLLKEDLLAVDNLDNSYEAFGYEALSQVAIVKLNGGLGTTMGCQGAKSAIPIHVNQTFLDVLHNQVQHLRDQYNVPIPLILLNSPYTIKDSARILSKDQAYINVVQHMFARIDATSMYPFSCADNPSQEWYPPGHGDCLHALYWSGTLQRLKASGIRYLFVSNADNLGPLIHPKILGYMVKKNLEMLIETTPKTLADVKGGALIRYDGRLRLLERAQVGDAYMACFEDMSLFPVFNTNNIWLTCDAIESFVSQKKKLDLIVNPKDIDSKRVYQLETALGSAISQFDRTASIVVNRERFLPVKKTSDLLVIKSDLIQKKQNLSTLHFESDLHLNNYPLIQLGSCFDTIQGFNERFAHIPSLKQLKSLSIEGDVVFGPDVILKGSVSIKVAPGKQITLSHCTLENVEKVFA